jgi:hypothetical protein
MRQRASEGITSPFPLPLSSPVQLDPPLPMFIDFPSPLISHPHFRHYLVRVVDRVHDAGALRVHLELGAVTHQRARRAVVEQSDLKGVERRW